MNIDLKNIKITKLQIIIIVLVVLGLIVSVILVQRNQTIKSRADEQIYNNLEVTGATCDSPVDGKSNCQLDENTNSITINGIQKLKELPAPE